MTMSLKENIFVQNLLPLQIHCIGEVDHALKYYNVHHTSTFIICMTFSQ